MKQIDRRSLIVGRDPRLAPKLAEQRSNHSVWMLERWAAGSRIKDIARSCGLPTDKVRKMLVAALARQHSSFDKWKRAEARCRELAQAIRLLRMPEPDQSIETLNPPPRWMKHLRNAKIETVNQLRTIDPESLLAHYRFDAGALHWAILTLDRLGLSHILRRPHAG